MQGINTSAGYVSCMDRLAQSAPLAVQGENPQTLDELSHYLDALINPRAINKGWPEDDPLDTVGLGPLHFRWLHLREKNQTQGE